VAKERIIARARTQYTDYMVKEPMELMEFLAAKMPDASRTKLKALLSKRVVYVDSVITTQYNFPLKPGMKVQISREKGRKEFNNKLLKIFENVWVREHYLSGKLDGEIMMLTASRYMVNQNWK
jgi:23S rRNA pseudouridine1911/1915/1917 synthase